MTRDRFLAWPSRAEAPGLSILVVAFALTFVVCYGGASVLSAWVPWRLPLMTALDERLPLVPGAAAVYLTLGPMLLLAPFVLRDLASLLPLFAALMLETVVAAACFLLLPVDPPPLACCEPGVAGSLFHAADVLNLERNDLPSLHVAFAFTLVAAFAPRAGRAGFWLLGAWALATAISTLLTRQHHVLDVAGGLVLAAVVWPLASRWARRPEVLAAFDIELLCAGNYGAFIARHRRYFVPTLAVLAAGIPHWRRQRLARTGFAFLQAVDDLLDGDRDCEREPLEVGRELAAALESGDFPRSELGRLGAAFRADLLARAGEPALATATALLRRMCVDRERVLDTRLSTSPELAELHRATFRGSLDLMLIAGDSPLRAQHVPELVEALGWCSALRDVDDDLAHGLVNLPREVAEAARLESGSAAPKDWNHTSAVESWRLAERHRGVELLDRADARLATVASPRGGALLRRFARSMRRYSSASSGATGRPSSAGAGTSGQRTT